MYIFSIIMLLFARLMAPARLDAVRACRRIGKKRGIAPRLC
jgi:hypothetical protein